MYLPSIALAPKYIWFETAPCFCMYLLKNSKTFHNEIRKNMDMYDARKQKFDKGYFGQCKGVTL